MLREYAIEPTLIDGFTSARYFLEKFGCDRGRLVGDYPGGWALSVLAALTCAPVEKARVEVLLARAKAAIVNRPGSTYDTGMSWLDQALVEDRRLPGLEFHALLADGVQRDPKVMNGRDIDEADTRWAVETDALVKRQVPPMADTVTCLLQASRHVRFIDPYFDGRPHKSAVVREFVRRAGAANRHGKPPTLEIHGANAKGASQAFVDEGLRLFALQLPAGVTVAYYQWSERPGGEQFHNRYVLTDLGGVEFASGLDSKGGGATDRVSLLSEATRRALWPRFDSGSMVYQLDVPATVLKR